MKPVSPVLPGQPEVVYAKDQPQYNLLPAIKGIDGMVITRWKLSWKERLIVLLNGDIYLQVLTFNRPLQPVKLSVEPPELMIVDTASKPIFNFPDQKLTADHA